MAESQRFVKWGVADAVDVAFDVKRTLLPAVLIVIGGEEGDLNDDAAFGGLGEEILEACEVGGIPFGQVPLAVVGFGPGGDVAAGLGGEGVAVDVEVAGNSR